MIIFLDLKLYSIKNGIIIEPTGATVNSGSEMAQ